MNKIFGYARVSTVDQNTDTQIEDLKNIRCDRIFQDKITGISTQRPALDEMLSLLREGDTVVVSRFFRLGRSRDHLINLVGDFKKKGIIFKALDLGIDSTTHAGKLIIGIFAALAEYDRESLLERSLAGQRLAKANGKHIGRPAGPNQEKFLKVKKAYDKGLSLSETVDLTNISVASVKRYRREIKRLKDNGV